jgi:hypothetical protein
MTWFSCPSENDFAHLAGGKELAPELRIREPAMFRMIHPSSGPRPRRAADGCHAHNDQPAQFALGLSPPRAKAATVIKPQLL